MRRVPDVRRVILCNIGAGNGLTPWYENQNWVFSWELQVCKYNHLKMGESKLGLVQSHRLAEIGMGVYE